MTQSELLAATDNMSAADDDGNTPPPQRRRLLGRLRRRDRKGQGENQLIYIIAAIAVTVILGGGAFFLVRALTSSSEARVLQQNIDDISELAEDYWQRYSGDIDGRRKIALPAFCQYANANLGEEGINLRTLQAVTGAVVTGLLELDADADVTGAESFHLVSNGTTALMAHRGGTTSAASCPDDSGDLVNEGANILISDTGLTGVTGVTSTDWSGTGTHTLGLVAQHTNSLEAAGLLSSRTVWIAQYGQTAANQGWGLETTDTGLPIGTDGKLSTAATVTVDSHAAKAEFLVIGGQAPDGTSFCLIKVFDAADPGDIGDYRVSRAPQDNLGFASCLKGTNATGVDAPRRGGEWPEPR
ncbi:hypothetical protein [Candidatus Poriferisodalis sp.]|uniref:hypothetical protein n=1 Tax=Candidatus Poriferisodalis sp. TaxID=3101277 RepID=UPI003D0AC437